MITVSTAHAGAYESPYPVDIDVPAATADRNRLTTAFRFILAIPHVLLVGAPAAFGSGLAWRWQTDGEQIELGSQSGLIGVAVFFVVVIAWFAILVTSRYPDRLRDVATFYLRWRVRAGAYVALLRDEYPPFGDGPYPAMLRLETPPRQHDRLSVALRIFLAIPHVLVLWALGTAWAVTSIVAWFAILFTGSYPQGLYDFGVGVFRWSIRVEAYLLLLTDTYPPFSFT